MIVDKTSDRDDIEKDIEKDIEIYNIPDIDQVDEKTKLAIQRTILANTRTFSAWIRTGLSSVLAGFAIVKFMGNNQSYQVFISIIGILFVSIGIGIYVYAYLSYKASYKELDKDRHNLSVPLNMLLVITTGLIITSLFIMALLVLYR
nr:DUF202 domain-containing protein [Tissierella sp.]